MNEKSVVDSVYTVINNATATLVSGIEHQGIARQIAHINKSILSPWLQSYAITIDCTSVEESFKRAGNTVRGATQELYRMEVTIVDNAFPQVSDTTQIPFEQMHHDFRLIVSRLVTLLKDTTVTFTDGSNSFRLETLAPVVVQNRTDWFDTQEVSFPVLMSVVMFTLVGC